MVKLFTTRPDTAIVHNLACQQYRANVVLRRKKTDDDILHTTLVTLDNIR